MATLNVKMTVYKVSKSVYDAFSGLPNARKKAMATSNSSDPFLKNYFFFPAFVHVVVDSEDLVPCTNLFLCKSVQRMKYVAIRGVA